MKRWRWNQMKRPLPTLIVAIQGTSLIIRNLPFVQFPPKADRGPTTDRQLSVQGTLARAAVRPTSCFGLSVPEISRWPLEVQHPNALSTSP